MSAETELMQTIREKYGDAIAAACASSPIPPALLAGLIANESGGIAGATRLETNVLLQLWDVMAGRKAAYGSIGQQDLTRFLMGSVSMMGGLDRILIAAVTQFDSLARSWGLTQIMGYNALGRGFAPSQLAEPARNLRIAVILLKEFVDRFHLDLVNGGYADLLHCWNTGHPSGTTADPAYTANGLRRAVLYSQLSGDPTIILPPAVNA